MCDKVVSEDPFTLKCCLDRYKTQEMCDKAVDACTWLAYYEKNLL